MTKAKIHGRQIAYELIGEGHPLVLISGYTSDRKVWMSVGEELSRHFQIVLFDNRGTGESDPANGPYDVEDLANDTLGLIEHLELKNPHIMGSSMGSCVAQILAFKHGRRMGKFILCYAFAKLRPTSVFAIRTLLKLRMEKLPKSRITECIMPWIFSNSFLEDTEKVDAFLELSNQFPYAQSEIEQKLQREAVARFDSRKWMQEIKAPLLLISGEEDVLSPPHDILPFVKKMPNAKVLAIPEMGHAYHTERPAEFCKHVIGYLKS